jgi:predicted RNA binding protein YcfA (HicA-like mRNA interferase family)
MRLPRDISGAQLVAALAEIGYSNSRQNGSHARLSHPGPPQHHVTVPMHDALRVGTFSAILSDVAQAQQMSKDELINKLFA